MSLGIFSKRARERMSTFKCVCGDRHVCMVQHKALCFIWYKGAWGCNSEWAIKSCLCSVFPLQIKALILHRDPFPVSYVTVEKFLACQSHIECFRASCVATGYQDCDYKGHNFPFMTLFIVQSDDLSFVSSWSVTQKWSPLEFKYMKKFKKIAPSNNTWWKNTFFFFFTGTRHSLTSNC